MEFMKRRGIPLKQEQMVMLEKEKTDTLDRQFRKIVMKDRDLHDKVSRPFHPHFLVAKRNSLLVRP